MPIAFDESLKVAAVGQVAPALAGEGQLDAHPAHLFQEKDPGSPLGRPSGGHQPRRPPSDDNDIRVQILMIHHRGTERNTGSLE